MSKLHQIKSYIGYWLNAVDKHSLQAPFIYDLYTKVIKKDADKGIFEEIENLRLGYIKSNKKIEIQDLGAGSKVTANNTRTVSSIASKGITKPKFSRLLYRLILHLKATNVVELGTSLGINTLYLAHNETINIKTFEGAPSLCAISKEMFRELNKQGIHLIEGNINETLPEFISQSPPIDLAFIDANHHFDATMNYFNLLNTKAHKGSCFVIDDIHWSEEMEKAWKQIKDHYAVTLSLDLYQIGIVFFNPDLRKQHYVLQF